MSLDGGSPIADREGSQSIGGTWGDDDTIVFTPTMSGGLMQIPADGGDAKQLIGPDGVRIMPSSIPCFCRDPRSCCSLCGGKIAALARLEHRNASNAQTFSWLVKQLGLCRLRSHYLRQPSSAIEILALPAAMPSGQSRPIPVTVQRNVFRAPRMGKSWFDISKTGTLIYAAARHRSTYPCAG